jgi:hypothetical protein
MGRVYLAFTPAGRAVALKIIRPDLGDDGDFRSRFRREAQAARQVHGIYTAQVLDADPDAVPPWLVTAYVPGPSLHEAVAEHGPMPEQTVLVLLAGVAEALAAIHAAGIVHRDLKPSNVLLASDGPRVIDFGIARAADATTLTRSGVRVGSPQFMAPEQVSGLGTSPAIDVFALGALGAFAALGRPPFGEGDEITVLYRVVHSDADLSGCPERLRGLLERCLAKDPAARPAPAEIIAACRAQAAGDQAARDQAAGDIAQPWLPPALAATLVKHAAPPPLIASPPLIAPAPVTTVLASEPATAVAVTEVIAGTPDRGTRAPGAPGARGARVGPVIAGGGLAAVGLAALLAAGLLALRGHGGSSPPTTQPAALRSVAVAGARHPKPSPPGPGAPPKPRPKASPPAVDACLVGTWTVVADDLIDTIDSNPVQFTFTGRGGYLIVRADGSGFEAFNHETMAATVNGNRWTDVLDGSVTMHIDTRGGAMLFSDVVPSKDATSTLYENGAFNVSVPTTLEPGPLRYTCSGNTLRTFATDGSSVSTRKG